jgi:hypothetical protein
MKTAIWLLVAFQWLFLLVLAFGDIGFDHPGRFGLDFGHFLLIAGLYLVALVAGGVLAVRGKAWYALLGQILVPLSLFLYQSWPPPRFDAVEYQHLVGKTRTEVEETLNHARPLGAGRSKEDGEETAFEYYRGMKSVYSKDGRVVVVTPDPD